MNDATLLVRAATRRRDADIALERKPEGTHIDREAAMPTERRS
jgi:hypothetical protein